MFFPISSHMLICGGHSGAHKKRLIVVIPQQVSISEQSPLFFCAGNLPLRNVVPCVAVRPHTHTHLLSNLIPPQLSD